MTTFIRAFGLAAALGLAAGAGPALAQAGDPGGYPGGHPGGDPGGYGGDRPPHARPGQCFRKLERPPLYETVREQVVDQPARVVTHIVPAQDRWEDRQVLVSPGRVDERPVPEIGHDVTETVVLRPPTVRLDTIPPVYDAVPVQVLVRPGRTYWKPSWGPTGEILCLVSEPPLYATQMRTVVREPARTVQTPIPGETRTVVRHVVDAPAHVERREVPPVYRTDHVRVPVSPERVESETIPATYRAVERRRLVAPGGWEWREIACAPPPPPCPMACGAPPPPPPPPPSPCATCLPPPSDAPAMDEAPPPPMEPGMRHGRRRAWTQRSSSSAANVTAQIQTALRKRGYYTGPVDGLYTAETGRALGAFEHDRGLPSGPPTPAVARALGVF